MAKKIYDIVPPKAKTKPLAKAPVKTARIPVKRKKIDSSLEVEKMPQMEAVRQEPVPEFTPRHRPIQKQKRFPMMEIIIGASVIVLLLGIYEYYALAFVRIEISPTMDVVSLEEKVTADKTAQLVNVSKKIIPAQYLEESQNSSQQFLATGSASNDGKASGSITVYNKISPATPLSLKVGTHFLSDGGKYFITLKKIVIPAMVGKTPGSIKVDVQAEESGADYNISSSKFSVPKLSGTNYYYGIWAESSAAMAGGYTGKVKKVTADDIAQAKDVLTKKLIENATTALKAKISQDQILLDGSLISSVVSANADVKPDSIADNFNENVSVKVTALVFKKQDVESFVRQDILAQLPEGKNLLEKSIDISYAINSIDTKKGSENISLKFSGKSYYAIDTTSLAEKVSEKTASQIQDIIMQLYGNKVSGVKINFWPFWVKSSPSNQNRIVIPLNLE